MIRALGGLTGACRNNLKLENNVDNGNRIEAVLKAIPYANKITEIKMSEEDAIRFSWKGVRFRVSGNLFVEQVEGGCLVTDNLSIIFRALLDKSKQLNELTAKEVVEPVQELEEKKIEFCHCGDAKRPGQLECDVCEDLPFLMSNKQNQPKENKCLI